LDEAETTDDMVRDMTDARTYGTVVVEDLNVAGMLGNRTLARHRVGLGNLAGAEVQGVPSWAARSSTPSGLDLA
jgi:hypothetical protein